MRLDTNLIENSIRPGAVGKKNRLFIGHPEAGARPAILYSMVISRRRHGIEPLVWVQRASPAAELANPFFGSAMLECGEEMK